MPRPWLIVTGDFVHTGGMDRANLALAERLADRDIPVHLVAHRVDDEFSRHPRVTVHRVPRPRRMHFPASFLLSRAARMAAQRLERPIVVSNGGNFAWPGLNWVQYLHAAWDGGTAGGLRAAQRWVERRIERRREARALRMAQRVICNSEQTARQVIDLIGVPAERVSVVYYGADADRFGPIAPPERARMRSQLGLEAGQTCVAFVGALGDHRKNFDTLFAAWRQLKGDPDWSAAVLLVIGEGAQLPHWQARADACGLRDSIRFLGFRADVADVLAACDLLVHPARYEAFGLSPFEALCRGVPVLVSASAGVSELIPSELSFLKIHSPDDTPELTAKLRDWRRQCNQRRSALESLSAQCRARSWDDMADEIFDAGLDLFADSSFSRDPEGSALAQCAPLRVAAKRQ